jgi:hypothetical protein
MEQIRREGKGALDRHDLLHVKAAECRLALGNVGEANREVESIRPRNRRHREVRRIRERIRAATHYIQSIIADNRILHPHWDLDFDHVIGRAVNG